MTDANQAARELADRYWEELLEIEPFVATLVGDERYDDRLSDPGPEGRARTKEASQRALDDLGRLDRSAMDEDERTTLAVMEAICKRLVAEIEHHLYRFTAVSHLQGPGQILAELASVQRADSPERVERYLKRLAGIPEYVGKIEDVAGEAAAAGQTVPTLVVDRTIGQIERLLGTPPEQSPGVAPIPESMAADRDRAVEILRGQIWPAYESYLEALRRYRPAATETLGLHSLPDGDAMYAATILAYTTLELDPQEVHDMGVAQLEKIQEERRAIAQSLGYGDDIERAVADYKATGQNTATSREAMVELARDQVRRSWDQAPKWFGRLPQVNCEVKAIEEFREKDMPGAFYMPPSADNSRPGMYYINCSDLDERPLHHVATTTYHEANPGHHFQISLEQEHSDRPPIRRFGGIFAGSAFAEGWGLYSERLADEMGLFLNDYERLGMLEAQAWRACRLIVDTGIHALGWDRERSIQNMMEGGVPRVDAEIEVDRYIANPGQALSYKIGQIEIEKQRAAWLKREGADSLPAFHDRLLSLGSLPLPALQGEMGDDAG
jgi:uncharacterized protein (DUF885 family)